MTIPTYVSGYPPDGSSLGSTKTTIRGNLDGTFLTLGVDHVNNNGSPGNNPAGYHTIIHQVTQTTIPSTISGVNQFFSMIPGTGASRPLPPNDTQLYSLSGMGVFQQITGSLGTTPGYVWCSGVLLQWGFKSSPGASGTVTFPVAFTANCFNVQLTTQTDPGGVHNFWINQAGGPPINNTRFAYACDSSSLNGFYWFAIGN